jgi:hypothetical protein
MGMDQNLYMVSKADYTRWCDQYTKYKKRKSEYEKRKSEIMNELELDLELFTIKYPVLSDERNLTREYINKTMTPEESQVLFNAIDVVHKYNNELDKLDQDNYSCDECSSKTELYYWRKAWGIHAYITNHFLKSDEKDNCERIPLSKENIQQIVDDMIEAKNNESYQKEYSKENLFGKHAYWDVCDFFDTLELFKSLLNNYDDNKVIYYFAWY